MMKKAAFALLFIFLLFSLSASASISIDSINKKQLNLGDKMTVSYNLSSSIETEAIFKLAIKCQNFDLDYYTIPASIGPDRKKNIIAPPLTINSQMLGKCLVKATVQSMEKVFSEELESDYFEITNNMRIKLETDGSNFFPGEKMKITGTVEESFNPEKTITLSIERQTVTLGTDAATFNQTIDLPKTMKSGEHKLTATANDSYGNSGETELIITMAQVPTSILIRTDKERVKPGEQLILRAVILDQANDSMMGKIEIKLAGQDKKELLNKDTESNQEFKYAPTQYTPPGAYTFRATSMGLKADKTIIINPVEDIQITFDGKRAVTVKNIGNVDYAKSTEIKLDAGGKPISITKKLNLKPGEELEVDLFKELPSGTYTMSFTSQGQQNEFSDIKTTDERPVLKKTADGLKGITAMVIGGDQSTGSKKALLTAITLFAILAITIVIYRSEKQRRKELAKKKADAIAEENAKRNPPSPEKEVEMARGNPQHQKFIENMLKEKQFK